MIGGRVEDDGQGCEPWGRFEGDLSMMTRGGVEGAGGWGELLYNMRDTSRKE